MAEPSITDRVIAFVRAYPHRTAWAIAKKIGEQSATVSSILHRKVKSGLLERRRDVTGAWTYTLRE